jgi:putative transposase
MPFDPSTYHRRSIRLENYDYTQPGAYFITITTNERKQIFGEILSDDISLNKLGNIVRLEWERLPKRFDHIELGPFVIMPNHLHGIIIISRRDTGKLEIDKNDQRSPRVLNTEQFGAPVEGSIPTIIRSFKSSVSLRCRLIVGKEAKSIWQSGYYEHIVRDVADMDRITGYIQANPSNWMKDVQSGHPDY